MFNKATLGKLILKSDFDNLNIFRNDPCLPEDGIEYMIEKSVSDQENFNVDYNPNVKIVGVYPDGVMTP